MRDLKQIKVSDPNLLSVHQNDTFYAINEASNEEEKRSFDNSARNSYRSPSQSVSNRNRSFRDPSYRDAWED